MKFIELSKGKVARIDSEDFARVNKHRWHYDGNYAARKIPWGRECGDGRTLYKKQFLHYFILGITLMPREFEIHHANSDKLDNRKQNLRVVRRKLHRAMHAQEVNAEGNNKIWKTRYERYGLSGRREKGSKE